LPDLPVEKVNLMTENYKREENRNKMRSWLIILGVVVFVALVGVIKNYANTRNWLNREPTITQLTEHRTAGDAVVVYFHSPDCSSCEQVQASLNTVYPEFKNSVILLDVDVTNLRERALVEQVGVQTAPTLLLVNAAGEEKVIVGEISPEDLRSELVTLSGGTP